MTCVKNVFGSCQHVQLAEGAYQLKLPEIIRAKLFVFNIAMVSFNLCAWVEYFHSFCCDLHQMVALQSFIRVSRHTYQCFALANMLLSEKELPIQIRDIYGIQIDHINVQETRVHERFQDLTACTAEI